MNLLLVGISHRSAPLSVLERFALPAPEQSALLAEMLAHPCVTEAVIISTCNRLEVCAAVHEPRAAAAHVSALLARRAGVSADVLDDPLSTCGYVHHDEAAVQHLFSLAAGLDSLILGDEQVLGQVRAAYTNATAAGVVGPVLHAPFQQALRVGKRVRTDTNLAWVGASVVRASLEYALTVLREGDSNREPGDRKETSTGPSLAAAGLAGRRGVVVGAGAMGSLAVAQLQRLGAEEVLVFDRTSSRASGLAASTGSAAVRALATEQMSAALAEADVVIVATSSPGSLVGLQQVRDAMAERAAHRGLLVVCDLGLPRNVEAAVAELPEVVVIDLEELRLREPVIAASTDIVAAERIVAAHLATHTARRSVVPLGRRNHLEADRSSALPTADHSTEPAGRSSGHRGISVVLAQHESAAKAHRLQRRQHERA